LFNLDMLKGRRVHARGLGLWPGVDVGHRDKRLAEGQDAQGGVEEQERMSKRTETGVCERES